MQCTLNVLNSPNNWLFGEIMKTKILALATLACSLTSFAHASESFIQFCSDRLNKENYVKNLTRDSKNLMAFRNSGGIANGGVCWWHSRFQRNALYLTSYDPAARKPTDEEAQILVKAIRSGDQIVEIPGYRNFRDFSADHQSLIQRELEKWQKNDGITKFNWVIGLSGTNTVNTETLRRMMDELYEEVEVKGNISYQKLQIKGITAHAWLVVNMKKLDFGGYDLEVLDSNYPNQTNIYQYRVGQTHFNHMYYGEFTPYLERTGEIEKLKKTINKNCL